MCRRLDSMIECLGACIKSHVGVTVFLVNLTLRASAQDKVVVFEGLLLSMLCKSLRLFEWIGIRSWSSRVCACVGSGAAGSVIGSYLIINMVSLIQHVTA